MRMLNSFCVLLACVLSGCQMPGLAAPVARDAAIVSYGGLASTETLADGLVAGLEPGQAASQGAAVEDRGTVASKRTQLAESEAPAGTVEPVERMRIYQGSITVEVARRDDAAAQFLGKVKEWGGYLSQQENDQVTVRVPAARFDEAFAWLHALGRVRSESKQATDVTDQYLDLGIRLDNAKKSRERLLALLAKAEKVEDMLKIEEQLHRLTEEIERFEGQLKRLQDQVALATITARFVAPAAAPDRPGGRPSRFAWIRAVGAERMLEGF
jgi:hypothetical protein